MPDTGAKGGNYFPPANKYIVYRLKTAIDILLAHEQRHLEQAREVRNQYLNRKN